MTLTLSLPDESRTQALAQRLAAVLLPDLLPDPDSRPAATAATCARLHLQGELGSGKTTFARTLLRACGVSGRIKSPSYALLESYKVSNLYLHHLDFYRFSKEQDWQDAGFREVLQQAQALILIEWPQQAGALLPAPDLALQLTYLENEAAPPGRQAQLTAHSTQGHAWLTTLKASLTQQALNGPAPGGGVCLPLPATACRC